MAVLKIVSDLVANENYSDAIKLLDEQIIKFPLLTIYQRVKSEVVSESERAAALLKIDAPIFKVVTPTYNSEEFLEETIESVLAQSGNFGIHYHIQDGGSSDSTIDIVKRYHERLLSGSIKIDCTFIKLTYKSENDTGMYDALSKGFSKIMPEDTDYMYYINSDDLVCPGAFAKCATVFQRLPNVDWITSRVCLVDANGDETLRMQPLPFEKQKGIEGEYEGRKSYFIMQEGTFWKGRLFNMAGGFRAGLKLAGDFFLWKDFFEISELYTLDEILAKHRRHEGQLSSQIDKYNKEIDQILTREALGPEHIVEGLNRRGAEYYSRKRYMHKGNLITLKPSGCHIGPHKFERTYCHTDIVISKPHTRALTNATLSSANIILEATFGEGFHMGGPTLENGQTNGIAYANETVSYFSLEASHFGYYEINVKLFPFTDINLLIEKYEHQGWLPVDQFEFKYHDPAPTTALSFSASLVKGITSFRLVKLGRTGGFGITSLLAKQLQRSVFLSPSYNLDQFYTRDWPYTRGTIDGITGLPRLPKISIIVPTYNQGEFIRDTLESIVNQNYPNLELIVVDARSTDNTLSVISDYSSHVTRVISEKDDGQSQAINKGLNLATGEVVTWLNSDDLLAPGALFKIATKYSSGKYDLFVGMCEVFNADGILFSHIASVVDGDILSTSRILDLEKFWLKGAFFHQPEVFMSKIILDQIKADRGSYVREDLFYSMDYELWYQFSLRSARVGIIGAPIANYRMHEAQKTSSVDEYLPELSELSSVLRKKASNAGLPITAFNDKAVEGKQISDLRILALNDVGNDGGAGVAHRRLIQSIELAGATVIPLAISPTWTSSGNHKVSISEIVDVIDSVDPDLIVTGNLHNYGLSIELLDRITDQYLTICVLHDAWLLTGGCAYYGNCDKYLTACEDKCPLITQYPACFSSGIARDHKSKIDIISKGNTILAANSLWMLENVQAHLKSHSISLDNKAFLLQLGIDTSIFKPLDKREARRLLDLPEDKDIILFGAASVEDPRKGADIFLAAINQLADEQKANTLVLTFGHDQLELTDSFCELRNSGPINSELEMALIYNASDLYISTAREEAFGQTLIEAAACNLRVLALSKGGMPDALNFGQLGRLINDTDIPHLGNIIQQEISSIKDGPSELFSTCVTVDRSLERFSHSFFSNLIELSEIGLFGFRLLPHISFERERKVRDVCHIFLSGSNSQKNSNNSLLLSDQEGLHLCLPKKLSGHIKPYSGQIDFTDQVKKIQNELGRENFNFLEICDNVLPVTLFGDGRKPNLVKAHFFSLTDNIIISIIDNNSVSLERIELKTGLNTINIDIDCFSGLSGLEFRFDKKHHSPSNPFFLGISVSGDHDNQPSNWIDLRMLRGSNLLPYEPINSTDRRTNFVRWIGSNALIKVPTQDDGASNIDIYFKYPTDDIALKFSLLGHRDVKVTLEKDSDDGFICKLSSNTSFSRCCWLHVKGKSRILSDHDKREATLLLTDIEVH